MTLTILEANIVKEPMKCKPTRAKLGKLSQHSLIENNANEFLELMCINCYFTHECW